MECSRVATTTTLPHVPPCDVTVAMIEQPESVCLTSEWRFKMKRIGLAALLMTFMLSSAAMAESACHSQAIGKNGKPLAGAALNSFMTKCTREACEPKAIGKDGRPLAGAAKTSFMKKCQSEA